MDTGPKWYILRGGHRIGPLDASQLKYMATEDQLDRADLVWKEGLKEWVLAGQVKGLFETPGPSVPPPPPVNVTTPIPPLPKQPAPPPAQPAPAPAPTPAPLLHQSSAPPAPTPAPIVKTPAPQPTPAPTPAPIVQTPAPQPKPVTPPAPAASPRRGGWLAVLAVIGAVIILLSIVVPWFVGPEYPFGPTRVVMSWNLVGNSFERPGVLRRDATLKTVNEFLAFYRGKTIVGISLIVTWSVALIALILALVTRGTVRAGILTALGTASLVFLFLLLIGGSLSFFSIGMLMLFVGILSMLGSGIAMLVTGRR